MRGQLRRVGRDAKLFLLPARDEGQPDIVDLRKGALVDRDQVAARRVITDRTLDQRVDLGEVGRRLLDHLAAIAGAVAELEKNSDWVVLPLRWI